MIFDWVYGLDLVVFYPMTFIVVAGAAEFGNRIGIRVRRVNATNADVSTIVAAFLGLLALLIAFSFSMAEVALRQTSATWSCRRPTRSAAPPILP